MCHKNIMVNLVKMLAMIVFEDGHGQTGVEKKKVVLGARVLALKASVGPVQFERSYKTYHFAERAFFVRKDKKNKNGHGLCLQARFCVFPCSFSFGTLLVSTYEE